MESITISSMNSFSIYVVILAITMHVASGQITTACTNSFITSFTPCMNFITGSTNGGGSPTADCCDAIASVISNSAECMCLMLTGNVPFGLPINRTLAISLPQVCQSTSAPLQCKSTATPLPGPGPASYGPSLPPLPPFASSGSGTHSAPPPAVSPSQTEPASPSAFAKSPSSQGFNQGQRPLVLPSSAISLSRFSSPAALLALLFGTMLMNNI